MIVFLSYAKEDAAKVARIYDDLKKAGYKPWMDKRDILPGQDWKFEIQNAISLCEKLIPLHQVTPFVVAECAI